MDSKFTTVAVPDRNQGHILVEISIFPLKSRGIDAVKRVKNRVRCSSWSKIRYLLHTNGRRSTFVR